MLMNRNYTHLTDHFYLSMKTVMGIRSYWKLIFLEGLKITFNTNAYIDIVYRKEQVKGTRRARRIIIIGRRVA